MVFRSIFIIFIVRSLLTIRVKFRSLVIFLFNKGLNESFQSNRHRDNLRSFFLSKKVSFDGIFLSFDGLLQISD